MVIKSISTCPENNDKGFFLSSFLVDGLIAIDAGSLGIGLEIEKQKNVKYILITHVHMDHTATLPIYIDNVIPFNFTPTIISTPENIDYLKELVFNDILWPNFERISKEKFGREDKFMKFKKVASLEKFSIEHYELKLFPSEHIVPTYGVKIIDINENIGAIFSSDTISLEKVIKEINEDDRIKAAFIELSFPNRLKKISIDSKHLYPEKFVESIKEIKRKVKIFVIHYKKPFFEEIEEELNHYKNIPIKPILISSGEEIKIEP